MKNFKTNIITKIAATIAFILVMVTACDKDFLDTDNPDRLSVTSFPSKLQDIDLIVNDVYGRMRHGIFDGYPQALVGISTPHYTDQAYIRNDFNNAAQVNFDANDDMVRDIWSGHYENVTRANAVLESIEYFRVNGANVNEEANTLLNYRKAEVLFLRAWNYFYLINYYGESFIVTDADRSKRGVPIIDKVPKSLAETQKPRNTVGEVWDFIIADLLEAESLLAGKVWTGGDAGRVNTWAVRSFLGKAYVFTNQFDKARPYLKDVIDNSSKSLMPFDQYKDMFNGKYPLNNESIFEIIYNPAVAAGGWGNQNDAVSLYGFIVSPSYINDQKLPQGNGFANYFVHDKNLPRFGYNFPHLDETKMRDGGVYRDSLTLRTEFADYFEYLEEARANKTIDPRMQVNILAPLIDSITLNKRDRAIAKNKGEGINITPYEGFSMRKNTLIDQHIDDEARGKLGMNQYWLRLADVYLLYAEANMTTDPTTALEYINKVKRRAYGLPVHSVSAVDYASLTAATVASDPVLANDPLKYERWAEFFGEPGFWWFDVCRWKIGDQEASYYEKVASGTLRWDESNYYLPIPQRELNANKIEQSTGYN